MADNKIGTDTAKRNPPNAGKGRPKGALNKTTMAAKEAIAMAADRLGGVDRLVAWVQEEPQNERVFWGTIYPKLLPLTVGGEADSPINVVTKVILTPMLGGETDGSANG